MSFRGLRICISILTQWKTENSGGYDYGIAMKLRYIVSDYKIAHCIESTELFVPIAGVFELS